MLIFTGVDGIYGSAIGSAIQIFLVFSSRCFIFLLGVTFIQYITAMEG